MHRTTSRLLSALLGAASIAGLGATAIAQPAQPRIAWHNDSSPTAGSGNAFPWGADGIRYQGIVSNAQMGGIAVITDIFVSGGTQPENEIVYGDIEIKMGVTTQATVVANWTTNNPNPKTVYRGPMRIRFKPGQWTAIGLPSTYLWLPLSASDNFVWEVIVWQVKDRGNGSIAQTFYFPLAGGSPSVPVPRAFRGGWVQGGGYSSAVTPLTGTDLGAKVGFLLNDGSIAELGKGCKSSQQTVLSISGDAGKWPRQGQVFNLNLSGTIGGTIAYLLLGGSELAWSGIPLPLDLVLINAPGCILWHDVAISLPTVTSPSGTASFPLALPGGASGLRLKASYAAVDAGANGFGLTTSNFVSLYVGQ